jgi:hypothetical protein
MIPILLGNLDHSWHYAGWISVDMRLLVFLLMLSIVGSVGATAILGRDRSKAELGAIFIIAFWALLVSLVLVFNQLAGYPVFMVDALFPFP